MKKISKKNLRLNKEVVASLSENEMQKVVGGDVTGKDTANESICICKFTLGETDCVPVTQNNCAKTNVSHCLNTVINCGASVDCITIKISSDCPPQNPSSDCPPQKLSMVICI